MKKILIAFLVFSTFSISAYARCPADDMGCTDDNYEQKIKQRIEKGKRDVWEADGVSEKAKAVGDTIRDCTDCGTKVIKDSMGGGSPR